MRLSPWVRACVRAFDGVRLRLLLLVSWWDAQQLGAKLLSFSRAVDIPVILPPTPHSAPNQHHCINDVFHILKTLSSSNDVIDITVMWRKTCALLWATYYNLHLCVISEDIPHLPPFWFCPSISHSLSVTHTHTSELMQSHSPIGTVPSVIHRLQNPTLFPTSKYSQLTQRSILGLIPSIWQPPWVTQQGHQHKHSHQSSFEHDHSIKHASFFVLFVLSRAPSAASGIQNLTR